MANGDSSVIPVEEGMVAGLEGTVVESSFSGPERFHMIYVKWDNGSCLSVLPYVDQFELIETKKED
jgi:hypothetical protein